MKYYTSAKLSENIQETPEGFLVCLGVPIARTGWQVYGPNETPLEVGSDGKVHIFRDSSEVFSVNTIGSFEGKPVTIEHPMDFVSPSNWKDLAKGILQNIRKSSEKDDDGEESLLADVLVTDSQAIALVKNGLREVSCGYEAVYVQTDDGKGRQTNIIGNHLALVREGRAGPGYAIRDHKKERVNIMSKLSEKVKGLFSHAMDEAVAEVEKKEKEESKDQGGKVEQKSDGSVSFDELVKMVKDLSDKVKMMDKSKDEEVSPDGQMDAKSEEEKKEMGDMEVSPEIESRLQKVEAMLSKLMEKESEEQAEEIGDEDKSEMVGDTAARAEILSPGIKLTKDVKVKALKSAYSTKDGKSIIDSLIGGKAPSFDDEEKVSNLFIAASEIMKAKRGTGLEGTKNPKVVDSAMITSSAGITPEKMNELNLAFYGQKERF